MSVLFPVALLFFPLGLFVPVPSLVSLCVYTFSYCSVILSDGSICACRWVCAIYGWSIILSVGSVYVKCLSRWVSVSVPFPFVLLFFLIGLFMAAGGSVSFMAGPLFFPIGLFMLCAFSGGSVYLYLLRLLYSSFWWVYLCRRWVCAFYGWSVVLSNRFVCVVYSIQWGFILSVESVCVCFSLYNESILLSGRSICFSDR